jgi:hypothetical protein
MPTTRTLAVAALPVGLFAVVLACGIATDGTAADKIPPSVTTLMAGWEQKFTLEWTVAPEPEGTRRIRGYVVSKYGQRAEPMRVLGRALDSAGGVLGERIEWIPGGVSGFGRAYFEIPRLPATDRYLVTVWDYSIVESERLLR